MSEDSKKEISDSIEDSGIPVVDGEIPLGHVEFYRRNEQQLFSKYGKALICINGTLQIYNPKDLKTDST